MFFPGLFAYAAAPSPPGTMANLVPGGFFNPKTISALFSAATHRSAAASAAADMASAFRLLSDLGICNRTRLTQGGR